MAVPNRSATLASEASVAELVSLLPRRGSLLPRCDCACGAIGLSFPMTGIKGRRVTQLLGPEWYDVEELFWKRYLDKN